MMAVVLGGGPTVWEDLVKATAIRVPDCVIATNDAGAYYPGHIHHWVTLHSEKMPKWWDDRLRAGHPPPDEVWFHAPSAKFVLPHRTTSDWGGSSGLLATKLALELGYDKIVLCGIPMEDGPHFHTETRMVGTGRYWRAWEENASQLADKVRSYVGRTAQLLGKPDEVWLEERKDADGAQGSTRLG